MKCRMILKGLGRFLKRHAGKILAGCAIASEVLGFWFMHKEAPIVKERLDELGDDATWIDKAKVAGPVYLPAFGMLLLSVSCIAGGCAVGERKAAILSSLYSASEAALMQYQDAVVKKLGKDEAQEIQNEIAADICKKNPPVVADVVETGKGDQLFCEPLTARYFKSSRVEVEAAVNRINKRIFSDMWVTANDWFYELGLSEPAALGDYVGWNVDNLMSVSFTPGETINCDQTCFVIGYINRPVFSR